MSRRKPEESGLPYSTSSNKRSRRPAVTTKTYRERRGGGVGGEYSAVEVEEEDLSAQLPTRGSSTTSTNNRTQVVVCSLPSECSVLELKSRLEMYGLISRIRIDNHGSGGNNDGGTGYVTFRSHDSAQAAISAALDPAFGITLHSKRVHVYEASDPLPQRRIGVRISPPSRLLRAQLPLRKHGRANKKLSSGLVNNQTGTDFVFKGREIVAYDDLL